MKKIFFIFSCIFLFYSQTQAQFEFDIANPGLEDLEPPYKEDEILVRYLSNLSEQDRDTIRNQVGAQIITNDFIVPNLEHIKLQGQSVPEALAILNHTPGVLYASPNYLVSLLDFTSPDQQKPQPPNDPLFQRSYGISLIGAPKSWEQFSMGSKEIVVAVIDTGIDYTHEDLYLNTWKNFKEIPNNNIDDDNNGFIDDIYGWNFVDNNNNPMDDQRHGTHVSGTIGALANNKVGTIGVSPYVSLMSCKFLDSNGFGSTDGAIRAISYAVANGARILNNSWGGGGFSQPLYDTIKIAERSGVLFVAAAGNRGGNNNDESPTYPASYDAANILAVAATDANDQLADFSSFGKNSVDLGAPGVDVLSTFPNNRYGTLSGTSMASPHAVGTAALILSYKPGLSVYELKDLILKTVDTASSLKDKTVSGGRINVYNALAFSLF